MAAAVRRRSGGNARFRGEDLHAQLVLPLTEAAQTHPRVITVRGKNIRITIPAGVADGQTIKLKGHGSPGVKGGPAGDLYIEFKIHNNTPFQRVGNDLYGRYNIGLYTAVLGGEVMVDTLNGKVKLKVQPGTQNNTKTRLKGKGFPVYKQGRGAWRFVHHLQHTNSHAANGKGKRIIYPIAATAIAKIKNMATTAIYITASDFCFHYGVERSFIYAVAPIGFNTVGGAGRRCLMTLEQLTDLEKYTRLHYELEINPEGIEAITYLLQRMTQMEEELQVLKAKLRLYEENEA